MAIAERTDKLEIADVVSRATKFYQQHESLINQIKKYHLELTSLKADVVQLLNARESMDRQVKEAQLKVAKAEAEAQTRVNTLEQGHRAFIDRLAKKEIDLDNQLKDMKLKDHMFSNKNRELELLKDEYERKLAGLTRLGK